MSQTTVVAMALAMLFVVYITLRGELGSYLAVFGIGTAGASSATAAGATAAGAVAGLFPGGQFPGVPFSSGVYPTIGTGASPAAIDAATAGGTVLPDAAFAPFSVF